MRDFGLTTALGGSPRAPVRAWVPAAGLYLTDERALYRVLGDDLVDGQVLVELEDCAQLVTLLVTERELETLRPVHAPDELAFTVMN